MLRRGWFLCLALILSGGSGGALAMTPVPALADSALHPCGPSLIQNGSFEQSIEPGSWTTLKAGSNSIDSWTITKGTVDVVGSLWAASDGRHSVDLDGVSFGGVAQSFKTDPGKTYVVTFDLSGNPNGPPSVKRMQVTAGDKAAVYSYDLHDKPHTFTGWAAESMQFVAKDKLTTLELDSLDTENGYFGPVIDNVRVQAACGDSSS